jgi:hypothetical protein
MTVPCSLILVYSLLLLAFALLLGLLIVRLMRLRKKRSFASDERYLTWLLLCLFVMAVLSIGVFVIYSLFFISH